MGVLMMAGQLRQAHPTLLYDFMLVLRVSLGPFPRRAHTEIMGVPHFSQVGLLSLSPFFMYVRVRTLFSRLCICLC